MLSASSNSSGATPSKVSVQFCAFNRFSRIGGAPEYAGPVHTKSFCRQRCRTKQQMTTDAARVRDRTCNSNINSSNSNINSSNSNINSSNSNIKSSNSNINSSNSNINSSNSNRDHYRRPMSTAAAAGDSSTSCPTISADSRDRGIGSPNNGGSGCSDEDDLQGQVHAAASTTINGATNLIYAADGDTKAKGRQRQQHQVTVIRTTSTSGDSSQQQITLVEGRRVYVVAAAPWPRLPREHPSEQYKSCRTRWSQAELRRIRELAGKRREAAEALRREREARRFRQPVYCLPRDLLSDSKARLMRWFKLDDEDGESLGRVH